MKSILASASLLFLASLANAQIGFEGIQGHSYNVSGRKTPVIADITSQTTSITPWGPRTQTLKGKFWRSRDGKNRQDDGFGTSFLLTPKSGTGTWVDRELQTVVRGPPGLPLFQDIFARRMGGTSLGKRIVAGRAVEGWRSVTRQGDNSVVVDFWLDTRLGIPFQIWIKSSSYERIQQLENIEERDPDPKLFEIPEGFRVVTCVPAISNGHHQPSSSPAGCGTGPSNSR